MIGNLRLVRFVAVAGCSLVALGSIADAAAAASPTIDNQSVSNVTSTDATVEAQIDTGGLETDYRLWIGTYPECVEENLWAAAHCEQTTITETLIGSSSPTMTSIDIATGWQQLSPGTAYVYSLRATNSAGTAYGASQGFQTFTTLAVQPPSIESESVSHVTSSDATLEAEINTEGLETTYEFHLMERTRCERLEPPCLPPIREFPLPSGKLLGSFVEQSVSIDLSSVGVTLEPGHDFYEYWVSATNAAGTTQGEPQNFTTPTEASADSLDRQSSGDGQRSTPLVRGNGTAGRRPSSGEAQPSTCRRLSQRIRWLRHRARALRRRAAHAGHRGKTRRLQRRSRRLALAARHRASRRGEYC